MRQTDFALLSTFFIRWACNFTRSTTMYTQNFVLYRPTSKNTFYASNWISFFFRKFCSFQFGVQEVFFLSIFVRWSIKYEKKLCILLYIVVRIQIVEMTAKSVWRIKISHFTPIFKPPELLTKNKLKWAPFWTHSFHFFRLKVLTTGELTKETIPIQVCTQMRSSPMLRVY
jgi:hypothetical protein